MNADTIEMAPLGEGMKIALLEDNPDQAEVLNVLLEQAGHACDWFDRADAFCAAVGPATHDLVILDWMLPDRSGPEVLDWIRENLGWDVPVLFVTARNAESDIVTALNRGADDYMTKPFKHGELIARLAVLGRRQARPPEEPEDEQRTYGRLSVIPDERVIYWDEQPISLTQKEYELALYLLDHIGHLLPRQRILESVWGHSNQINTRTVDTHVSRLRNKLGFSPENGWRLSAIYQHGYRLERLDEAVVEA